MPTPTESTPNEAATGMDWERFFKNYRAEDFIPGYRILNKLGSGVFGEVYRAEKVSIGKPYAIKFLRLQDESLREQVMRELGTLSALAQLDHPHLVSIEDRGEVCGIPFVVMGFAGEETLKTRLGDGPLPIAMVERLFTQMLEGVRALHERAVIHFDLKPANVFLKGDVVRIGDYGLSRLMSESRATLSMGRGTPHYMAPEMLHRRGDARSDVYSLGIILFEMLTGDVPFTGDSEWEILRAHERESPKIPSSIAAPLRTYLERALAKNPKARFADADEALIAFQGALRGLAPAPAPGAPAPTPSTEASRRPRFAQRAAAGTGRRLGEAAGRLAGKGVLSVERVREDLHDILHRVRRETRDAVTAARSQFQAAAPARPAPPEPRLVPRPKAPRRGLFRSLFRLITLPFRMVGWSFRNYRELVAAAVLTAIFATVLHLGLRAAIL